MTAEAPAAPALSYGRLIPATVHFDDLDALGLLHNARYPVMVERAWAELWQGYGFGGYEGDWEAAGDFCNAVRELRIGYEAPVKPARRLRRAPVAGAARDHRADVRIPVLLGGRGRHVRPRQPGAGAARCGDAAARAVERAVQGRGSGTAAPGPPLIRCRSRSPARSTPANTARPHASTVTRPNDTIRLVASASVPIAPGATRPEV